MGVTRNNKNRVCTEEPLSHSFIIYLNEWSLQANSITQQITACL